MNSNCFSHKMTLLFFFLKDKNILKPRLKNTDIDDLVKSNRYIILALSYIFGNALRNVNYAQECF